jgi:hypothetical protein
MMISCGSRGDQAEFYATSEAHYGILKGEIAGRITGMRGRSGWYEGLRSSKETQVRSEHEETPMNVWRAIGPELTVGLFLLFMVAGMFLTFFLSR